MAHNLIVKVKQQGLAEQFTLVAHLQDTVNNSESSEYIINDLVKIVFMIKDRLHLIISAKKCEAVHSAVNINVTCTNKSFSKQWFITDEWTKKYLSSNIRHDSLMYIGSCKMYTYHFEFNVIVSKMIMVGPLLYEDDNFTDFRLSTVDGSVGVHKASLAAHSDMFKAMLNGEWKETVEGRIEVEGASLQTLRALKGFIYLGKLPDVGLQTLLQIAIRFFIESLKRECIIKLAQNATPEEYLELLDLAKDNEMVDLTFALMQLTPKKVIHSAYEMMIERKQLSEAGDKTDKE